MTGQETQETSERNLEYSLSTFVENAKTYGFGEAWEIDKEVTTSRHPYLVNVHEMGKRTALKMSKTSYERFDEPGQSFIQGFLQICNLSVTLPLGYITGGIFGALEAKPSHLERGETQ